MPGTSASWQHHPPVTTTQRVLVVVAHPDDETFGTGSAIAGAARVGADVTVCCATRGGAGGDEGSEPVADLAAEREAELRAAAAILGAGDVALLGYGDSGMGGAPPPCSLAAAPLDEVTAAVRAVVERVDPHVVVTLDPDLGGGHATTPPSAGPRPRPSGDGT